MCYNNVIKAFPNADLAALYKHLEFEQACDFTYHILESSDESVLTWMKQITPAWKFKVFSFHDIAIDMFKENAPEWLNDNSKIFETIYEESLYGKTERGTTVILEKIKTILSYASAGLSNSFFKNMLSDNKLEPLEETDLLLLWIKLHGEKEFDDIEIYITNGSPDSKLHLAPAFINFYQKRDPIKGLGALAIFDSRYYNLDQRRIDKMPWLCEYLSIYIIKSLKNALETRSISIYMNLRNLIRENIREIWVSELITDALQQPVLEDLAKIFSKFEQGDYSDLKNQASAEELDRVVFAI